MSDLADRLNQIVDNALEAENAAQPPRTYLGASEIGNVCERKLAFKWHGFAGEPFRGRGIRRFRMGHIHEDETVRWLRLAGFTIANTQSGFSLADGKFAGHVDGVITAGPFRLSMFPMLFEHKIMKSTYRREVSRVGVEATQPKYFAQGQIYMRQFSLANMLFTALNTDTSELYFEIVPYDAAKAELYIDRARRILSSESPKELPRAGVNDMDFTCKFCPFKATCWAAPVAPAAPAPSWMRKA